MYFIFYRTYFVKTFLLVLQIQESELLNFKAFLLKFKEVLDLMAQNVIRLEMLEELKVEEEMVLRLV